MKTQREIRLEAALRAIYEITPHVTYFFPHPERFEPVRYDVWLHDFINEALNKPGAGLKWKCPFCRFNRALVAFLHGWLKWLERPTGCDL